MPFASPVACHCGQLNCVEHSAKQVDRNDPSRKVYQSRRWRFRTRPYILARDPLCRIAKICVELYGQVKKSTQVDHVIPMADGGDPFLDSNLQGVCDDCHAWKTVNDELKRTNK